MVKIRSDDPWEEEPIGISMNLSRFVEPVLVLTLLSVIFYILSFGYYRGFFERLSIPYNCLNLPITYYLSIGYWTALIFSVTISYIFFTYRIWHAAGYHKSLLFKKRKYWRVVILYLLLTVVCFFMYIFFKNYLVTYSSLFSYYGTILSIATLVYIWILILIVSMGVVQYIKYKLIDREFFKLINSNRNSLIIMFIFIFIIPIFTLGFLILPTQLGSHSAANLIEGHPGSLKIVFELDDENNDTISNKTLILIMFHDNIYYTVEKTKHAPKRASLYMIHSDRVKYVNIVTIEDLDGRNRSFNHTKVFQLAVDPLSSLKYILNRENMNV